jgi:hypothetical protein
MQRCHPLRGWRHDDELTDCSIDTTSAYGGAMLMRARRRVGLALLPALALATSAFAQSTDRASFNVAAGPSFANVGTTFSAQADLTFSLNDRTSLVGEFGMLRHAPLADATAIAPPLPAPTLGTPRVNGYHWNGNVRVQAFEVGRLRSYVTGGLGTFTTDTIVETSGPGSMTFEDRRRVTDFSTNVGAGASYPFNEWVGVNADYRTFFVHRGDDTPHVHRFTTGLTFSIK